MLGVLPVEQPSAGLVSRTPTGSFRGPFFLTHHSRVNADSAPLNPLRKVMFGTLGEVASSR